MGTACIPVRYSPREWGGIGGAGSGNGFVVSSEHPHVIDILGILSKGSRVSKAQTLLEKRDPFQRHLLVGIALSTRQDFPGSE